jgi:hypothetical protein
MDLRRLLKLKWRQSPALIPVLNYYQTILVEERPIAGIRGPLS